MAKKLPEITIVTDTREQKPWTFDEEEKQPGKVRIAGNVVECLDAGDYSIKGLEHLVRIERKMGFRELFGNMSPTEHRDRFEREMEKLRTIPFKYLLIESNLSHDILALSVPQYQSGPPASRVLDWLTYLNQKYGIHHMFVGECGQRVAKTIFKQIARDHL